MALREARSHREGGPGSGGLESCFRLPPALALASTLPCSVRWGLFERFHNKKLCFSLKLSQAPGMKPRYVWGLRSAHHLQRSRRRAQRLGGVQTPTRVTPFSTTAPLMVFFFQDKL